MTESSATVLAGCRIWVTRPRAQAQALCELIRNAGGNAIEVPVTEMVPAPDQNAASTALRQIAQRDLCIFISRNAVRFALELAPALASDRGKCMMLAVGAGTAAELSGFGISAATGPGPAFSADDLLTLPQLQASALRGRSVMIIRGTGGQETLRDELMRRGADVCYAEVYERRRTEYDPEYRQRLWRQTPPDVIVLTSVGAVRALLELTPKELHSRLLQSVLVVISERVSASARRAGFAGPILIAAGATDPILYQTLVTWRSN